MLGLYVHIPFCDRICTYCDFAKVKSNVLEHKAYLAALANEYALYQHVQKGTPLLFDTVYFGGGTPSALSVADLTYLLNIFAPVIAQATEITFEANPDSLTVEKIKILHDYGVNRISLGVQSFDERRLRFLNRGHTNAQVEAVVDTLRDMGMTNINLDLMYGLPEQSVEALCEDVTKMLMLRPAHISTYALIWEPHTMLYLQLKQNKLKEVDEARQELMYRTLQRRFEEAGYQQYEFSNWAQPGALSRHNTKYWNLTEYIGLGLGAHGFYRGKRYANTRSIVNYMQAIALEGRMPQVEAHQLSARERMEETLFLGLRMRAGVSKQQFRDTFGQTIDAVFAQAIAKHVSSGFLKETSTHYKLSSEAFFISNEILSDFLLDVEKE